MASKLETHKDFIATRLGAGVSIVAIATELAAAGVTTTPQNLGRWIQRRKAKIKSRKKLVGQLAVQLSENTTPDQT